MLVQGKAAKSLRTRILTPSSNEPLQIVMNDWLSRNSRALVYSIQYQVGNESGNYKPSVLIIYQVIQKEETNND